MDLKMSNLPSAGFVQLGLKAGTQTAQLFDRLKYQPQVFEFYTNEADFSKQGFQHLSSTVKFVQTNFTRQIIIHHPMSFHGQHTDILTPKADNPELVEFFQRTTAQLLTLAKQQNVTILVHGGYGGGDYQHLIDQYPSLENARQTVIGRLQNLVAQADGHLVIENGITPTFMYGDPVFDRQLLAAHLPLACDISHVFIGLHGNSKAFEATLTSLRPLIRHYHLVDSFGLQHDSLALGQGKIDWQAVYQRMNRQATMIFEIPDETDATCSKMLASYHYLKQIEEQQIERIQSNG